ncbi:hypothetical protein EV363DRAFT_743879 [Boletus edulis]|nr:hypothetical protein EV363DRAFT_743879 [Boletus edulis]
MQTLAHYLVRWKGPLHPLVVPGTDPTLSPLESLGEYTANETTWVVNLASGTYIVLTLKDALGDLAQTAPVTVEPGTSTCLSVSLMGPSGF